MSTALDQTRSAWSGSRLRRLMASRDESVLFAVAVLAAIPLLIFFAYPLAVVVYRSFVGFDGTLGFGNYQAAFATPSFWRATYNSLEMTLATTALSVAIGFVLAYAMHRSCMPGKGLIRLVILMPLLAPSLVQGLGLIFLFGRNGIVNQMLGTSLDIYGFYGLVIANTLYAFPQTFLLLSAALAVSDARLSEAADTLGASRRRIFLDITLPGVKFGLISAIFLAFTITITDFGNAMVIGGDYGVLASEIYNQVIGQMNFNLGAVIGIILLLPAAVAFAVERFARRRQFALLTAQAVPYEPRRALLFDGTMLAFAALICGFVLIVIGIVIFVSFTRLWPYNLTLTLRNYTIDLPGGFRPLWTSIQVSLLAAGFGVLLVVTMAYVVQKANNALTRALYFLSILPAAVPGMVLGLAYIMAFNDPRTPLYLIYGTIVLLAICNFYHYHAQGFLAATTSLKQISETFEEAAKSLGSGFFDTMRRVIVPIIMPTILAVAVFFFMRSMVSLSAVVFLVTPRTQVAAVTIMRLDETGFQGQAAAFSTAVIAVVVGALLMFRLILRMLGYRGGSLIA